MPPTSSSPPIFGVVILPSYNPGAKLLETAAAARRVWEHVWVVIDGSTDGSARAVEEWARSESGIEIIRRPRNGGKGEAVLDALRRAREIGIARALVMDADGQHPPEAITTFFDLARRNPDALILGAPIFAADAPRVRVQGRRIGNFFARVNTGWANVADSLFGFRVYPVNETFEIMNRIRTARGFDFDTEMVVRLIWAGFRPLNVRVPVRYLTATEGGSSHLHYVRDNALLIRTHARLFFGMLARLPRLLSRRRTEVAP